MHGLRSLAASSRVKAAVCVRAVSSAERIGLDAVSICFGAERLRFHWLWLRDNCLDGSSRTVNGQRLFETADLVFDDKRFTPVAFAMQPHQQEEALSISWADGHTSAFPLSWLRKHAYDVPRAHCRDPCFWDSSISSSLPEVAFSDLETDDGKVFFCQQSKRLGFCLVRGVPRELGMVAKVGNMIGSVRRTNYGDIFDVIDKGSEAENLAYTNVSVTMHTDNPYRDPVPGVQLLHCLKAAGGSGGETMLVDGFAAAEELRRLEPEAFNLLTDHPRDFRYMDLSKNTDLRNSVPVIQLDAHGGVCRIHFNNRSADVPAIPYDKMLAYYRAWSSFQKLLQDPGRILALKLQPGDLLSFENHRVLHGRAAYQRGEARHLQGAYIDVDAVRSRVAAAAERS